MPWHITQQDGKFCVVKKSDDKVVKCHPTEKLAKLHLTALYANEPSASKKSVGYGMLKSLIEERVDELKGCGANQAGGGGFRTGNTCARGGGPTSTYQGPKTSYSDENQWKNDTSKLSYWTSASGNKTQALNSSNKVMGEWDGATNKGWIRKGSVEKLRESEQRVANDRAAANLFAKLSKESGRS